MSRIKHLQKNKSGAAAVEMALLLPAFLLFVFGLIEFSRAYWVANSMQLALDETGRYVMLNTLTYDVDIIAKVKANLSGQDTTQFTVTSTSLSSGGVNYKVITANYNFDFMPDGILPFATITITRSTTVPLF